MIGSVRRAGFATFIRSLALSARLLWAGDPAIPDRTIVGTNVYIGPGVSLDWRFGHLISIGDDSTIVAGTRILCHDASSNRRLGVTWCAPVSIGRRVYIGADSLVMPGVTIGDDSVIAAGAVVTRDVRPGVVVAGVPAREISTVEQLDAKRDQLRRTRPVFGPEFGAGRLSDAEAEQLSSAARTGGYFLGRPAADALPPTDGAGPVDAAKLTNSPPEA